jgi:hypothetical protein
MKLWQKISSKKEFGMDCKKVLGWNERTPENILIILTNLVTKIFVESVLSRTTKKFSSI